MNLHYQRYFFQSGAITLFFFGVMLSFLMSDILAALLYSQLEHGREITRKRLEIWDKYYDLLKPLQVAGDVTLPIIPEECQHNGHMFYLLTPMCFYWTQK